MEYFFEAFNNSITPLGAILMLLFNPITILYVMDFIDNHRK